MLRRSRSFQPNLARLIQRRWMANEEPPLLFNFKHAAPSFSTMHPTPRSGGYYQHAAAAADSRIAMFSTTFISGKGIEAVNQEKRDILVSLLPNDTCRLSDVYDNFYVNHTASGSAHSVKANYNFMCFAIDVMRDVAYQLWGIHRLGNIIGSFNHENVLISKPGCEGEFMRIDLDGEGIGWKAPIQILEQECTTSTDMFNFGCILYFCLSGGVYPFGHSCKGFYANGREIMIDLSPIRHIPEAAHLVSLLLSPNPELRPSAEQVLHHPLFRNVSWKREFLDGVFTMVKRGRQEKLITALKSEMPMLADRKWLEMFFDVDSIIFGCDTFDLLDLQCLSGPYYYTGFFAELVSRVFKIVSAADAKIIKKLSCLDFIDYHEYFLFDYSYFRYGIVDDTV